MSVDQFEEGLLLALFQGKMRDDDVRELSGLLSAGHVDQEFWRNPLIQFDEGFKCCVYLTDKCGAIVMVITDCFQGLNFARKERLVGNVPHHPNPGLPDQHFHGVREAQQLNNISDCTYQ